MSIVRRSALFAGAALALCAAPASAEPNLKVTLSSPVTWTGSSVTVTIRSTETGILSLAQTRRYKIVKRGYSSCESDDKYATTVHGTSLIGPYLAGSPQDPWPLPIEAGKPLTIKLPATRLLFGAGDFSWANTQTWPGCRTAWTQYTRLGVWWSTSLPGPYYSEVEKLIPLTRVL